MSCTLVYLCKWDAPEIEWTKKKLLEIVGLENRSIFRNISGSNRSPSTVKLNIEHPFKDELLKMLESPFHTLRKICTKKVF